MTTSTSPTVDSIAANPAMILPILERQRSLYEKLRALSERQSSYVAEGDAGPLLGVLAARQTVIEELARIHEQLKPVRPRWREVFGKLSLDEQKRAMKLVDDMEKDLFSVIASDEADRKKLKATRDDVAGQLAQTGKQNAAVNAYRINIANVYGQVANHQG